jgi:hypothetical protein
VLYVLKGKTARFVWDYTVGNRETDFASSSPTWHYRYQNTTQIQIAYEYKWRNPRWKWTIASSCPESLRYRVSKESSATLVIADVTTADNGIYGCSLLFRTGNFITHQVQLIVTGT